jgi:hypothetical protein
MPSTMPMLMAIRSVDGQRLQDDEMGSHSALG